MEDTQEKSPLGETFIMYHEDINFDSLERFTEVYNRYMRGEINYIHMYLCSDGGDIHAMEVMIDMINDMGTNIGITAFGHVASAAFQLFFRAECPCRILPGTLGMMHQSRMNLLISESGKTPHAMDIAYQKYKFKYAKDTTVALSEFLKFTKKELNEINNSKDVWFSFERMQEMLRIKEEWLFKPVEEAPMYIMSSEDGIA